MPLHTTGLISRRALDHPDETQPVKAPAFETVLKFNPHHGSDGRFVSNPAQRTIAERNLVEAASVGYPRYSTQRRMDGGFARPLEATVVPPNVMPPLGYPTTSTPKVVNPAKASIGRYGTRRAY